jgi:hypothetical protein
MSNHLCALRFYFLPEVFAKLIFYAGTLCRRAFPANLFY